MENSCSRFEDVLVLEILEQDKMRHEFDGYRNGKEEKFCPRTRRDIFSRSNLLLNHQIQEKICLRHFVFYFHSLSIFSPNFSLFPVSLISLSLSFLIFSLKRCTSGKMMKVPPVDSYVVVLPPEQPSIAVNGTSNLAREYESFVQGIELFSTVSLVVNNEEEVISEAPEEDDEKNSGEKNSDESSSDEENEEDERRKLMEARKLDSCTVQVYPPLNPDHEYFRLPVNYMSHLGIHYKETKDGLVIHGADTIHSYQTILRQVVYFNRKPAYYLNRAFKLSCSELNGRFKSNDYIQTLTVIHPKPTTPPSTADPTSPDPTSPVPTSTDRVGELLKKSPASLNDILMNDDSHLLNEPFPARAQVHDSFPARAQVQDSFPARAQVHDHLVQMKDSRVKSTPVSGAFLDSGLMDAGDAFARTSVNTSKNFSFHTFDALEMRERKKWRKEREK